MGMLIESVERCGDVQITAYRVVETDFKNWDEHLNKHYKDFSKVQTLKWQIFQCENST